MSVGDARRRDNGLEAAAYAAAGDVDPRVGEHLLDVLALEGVAAYLRPSSDQHPVTWSTTLPKRPTDRLFVDREHLPMARDLLARLAREEAESPASPGDEDGQTRAVGGAADEPGGDAGGPSAPRTRRDWSEPTSAEVDRAFEQIVAGLGRTLGGRRRGGDERPEDTEHGPRSRHLPPERRGAASEPEDEPSLLDALDTFGSALPDDGSDRFVPPEPPPVPRPSPQTALAVVGVIGGLAVFLKPELLSFLHQSLAMLLGFASVVAGFGALVWRLRPGGDDDETDPDHGARV